MSHGTSQLSVLFYVYHLHTNICKSDFLRMYYFIAPTSSVIVMTVHILSRDSTPRNKIVLGYHSSIQLIQLMKFEQLSNRNNTTKLQPNILCSNTKKTETLSSHKDATNPRHPQINHDFSCDLSRDFVKYSTTLSPKTKNLTAIWCGCILPVDFPFLYKSTNFEIRSAKSSTTQSLAHKHSTSKMNHKFFNTRCVVLYLACTNIPNSKKNIYIYINIYINVPPTPTTFYP